MLNTLVAKTLSKVFKGTATDPNSKIPGRRSDLSIRMRQVFFICSSITFSITTFKTF